MPSGVVSSLFKLLCAFLGASLGTATLARMGTLALPTRLARAAAFLELIAASKDVSTSTLLHPNTPFGFASGPTGPRDLWPLNFSTPVRPSCHGEIVEPLVYQTNRHNNTAFKEHLLLPGFECPLLSSAGPTEMRARPPDNYSCLWKVQALRSFPYKHEPNTNPLSCEACDDELIARLNSTVPKQPGRYTCDSECASFTESENKTAKAQEHGSRHNVPSGAVCRVRAKL